MNFGKSLKSHFLAYRFFYLVFFVLNYSFVGATLLFFEKNEQLIRYLFLIIIACSLVFTLLLGIYEYQVLFPNYLGLSNLKRRFHIGSFFFNIFHSFTMLVHILGLFTVILSISFASLHFIFPYDKFALYCLVFSVHMFIYAVAGFLTILFRKILFLIKALLLFLTGIVGYYLRPILLFFDSLITSILKNFKYCTAAALLLFAGFLVIHLFIVLKE